MSITNTYVHTFEEGIETYAFQTALRETRYRHLVDRVDDGPWKIWPLAADEHMSVEIARAYIRELEALAEFAEKLSRPAPRRTTEPGAPAFEGDI